MKLTQVCKILELSPIPGADRIEKARVLGWDCVVQKGLHRVGDLVIFVFPDTLIPKQFIDSTYDGEEKVRLKTIRLRGQFSAGLILPLSELGPVTTFEGDDVGYLLCIEKYEKPMPAQLAGKVEGHFPRHIVEKTDEDNYRSNPEAMAELRALGDTVLVATVKADGTSATFLVDPSDNQFKVCSRNYRLTKDDSNAFWEIAAKLNIEQAIRNSGKNLAVQGELVGEGIQGNPMGVRGKNLLVFLIKDLDSGDWYSWNELVDFCLRNSIDHVSVIFKSLSKDLKSNEELQEIADNLKYPNGKPAEGFVLRPVSAKPSASLSKSWLSLKFISQPYDQKSN
jgi:RNA ligase (TIGR02306 family)